MSFFRSSRTILGLPGPRCNSRPLSWPRMASMEAPKPKPRPRRTANLLMYSSAVVPLYRVFCAATGFAGTPKVGTGRFEADRLVPVENAHRIKVHFNADRAEALPWTLAFYTAKNHSKNDIIGIATYNVTPDRQGRKSTMPLLFFIDKDILDDPACRDIDDVVLSYTFFRARRNQKGHLEPDAADEEVQNSMGFGGYEHAPKAEVRNEKEKGSK
ncbi:cytochrome c oxidase assembly protein CtaG/Cox11, domain-containing protein, partial [Mycena filopes]